MGDLVNKVEEEKAQIDSVNLIISSQLLPPLVHY